LLLCRDGWRGLTNRGFCWEVLSALLYQFLDKFLALFKFDFGRFYFHNMGLLLLISPPLEPCHFCLKSFNSHQRLAFASLKGLELSLMSGNLLLIFSHADRLRIGRKRRGGRMRWRWRRTTVPTATGVNLVLIDPSPFLQIKGD
jgi:hypothetical protein